jgi:hypothetical protein
MERVIRKKDWSGAGVKAEKVGEEIIVKTERD